MPFVASCTVSTASTVPLRNKAPTAGACGRVGGLAVPSKKSLLPQSKSECVCERERESE